MMSFVQRNLHIPDKEKLKENLHKYSIGSDAVIYAIRCVIGFLIGYSIYTAFPQYELFWMMLSIILVISPVAKDSKKLAIERSKANLIGSLVALLCYLVHSNSIFVIIAGILVSIFLCYLFNLTTVTRTAIVALLIILVDGSRIFSWQTAVERFVFVAFGCLTGLLVTISTSWLINFLRRRTNLPEENL